MRGVLVVDDKASTTRLWSASVAALGFPSREANSVAEALVMARRWQPALVLVDLELGAEDGSDLVRALRADPVLGGLRVAAVTSDPRRAGSLGGCDVVLPKPVRAIALATVVRRLLGGGQDGAGVAAATVPR